MAITLVAAASTYQCIYRTHTHRQYSDRESMPHTHTQRERVADRQISDKWAYPVKWLFVWLSTACLGRRQTAGNGNKRLQLTQFAQLAHTAKYRWHCTGDRFKHCRVVCRQCHNGRQTDRQTIAKKINGQAESEKERRRREPVSMCETLSKHCDCHWSLRQKGRLV